VKGDLLCRGFETIANAPRIFSSNTHRSQTNSYTAIKMMSLAAATTAFQATMKRASVSLLLLLICLLVATHACVYEKGGSTIKTGTDGVLNCGSAECQGGTITGCTTVNCNGSQSCLSTSINNPETVNCDGATACIRTTIKKPKNVNCLRLQTCTTTNIQQIREGGHVLCRSTSCKGTKIGTEGGVSGKFDVTCDGPGACDEDLGEDDGTKTSIKTSGLVTCKNGGTDDEACRGTQIEAGCLNCDGTNSCDVDECSFTRFGTGNTDACPASGLVGGPEGCGFSDQEYCALSDEDLTNCELRESIEYLQTTVDEVLAHLESMKMGNSKGSRGA